MSDTTVRMAKETRQAFKQLAEGESMSLGDYFALVARRLQRAKLIEETNKAYARVWADADAAAELEEERGVWDGSLADGLDEE